jgi:hypothetical protein
MLLLHVYAYCRKLMVAYGYTMELERLKIHCLDFLKSITSVKNTKT